MEKSPDRNLSLLNNEFLVTFQKKRLRVEIQGEGKAKVGDTVVKYDFVKINDSSYSLLLNNKSYVVDINGETTDFNERHLSINSHVYALTVDDKRSVLRKSLLRSQPHGHQFQTITAPMPGLVVRIEVQVGEQVKTGQGLLVLEAMKMENEINAIHAGRIEAIHVSAGKVVEKGERLLSVVQ